MKHAKVHTPSYDPNDVCHFWSSKFTNISILSYWNAGIL